MTSVAAENRVVQGLWIGADLSKMEQLSITSFLQNGHEYHLYVYDNVLNVPAGTVVKNASDILPRSSIFQYKHTPSYAGFANFFRYKLLLERGGWWTDTDVVCLRSLDFVDEYVFATEIFRHVEVATSCIIKAPAGSDVMAHCWKVCQAKDTASLRWGETGPGLMAEAVREFSLQRYLRPAYIFCPVRYQDWNTVLEPASFDQLNLNCYTLHLWNEKWREAGQDKNDIYPSTCIYEQLKRRYFLH